MRFQYWLCAVAAVALTGCYVGNTGSDGASGGSGGVSGAAGSGGSAGTAGAGGGAAGDGLPCDVSAFLQNNCTSCHSAPPQSGGAIGALLTLANLQANSVEQPGQTVGAVAVSKLNAGLMPPPPAPRPDAAGVGAFVAWVNAGMPAGSCQLDGGSNPYNTPVQCTSGTTWRGGDEGSGLMSPGNACIACHSRSGGEAPSFSIAGTVYPTAHEPNDCNGVGGRSTAVRVIITDANGTQIPLTPNSAGNFALDSAIALPYRAKVVSGSNVREMTTPQSTGDCNSCHTQDGSNGAPGRIMAP